MVRLKSYRAPTATLRVVNRRLKHYRERWIYCVGGWILLQEWPV